MTGDPSSRPERFRIVHLYADVGCEDPVLSLVGDVVRVGWDPDPNPFSQVVQADARYPPLTSGSFDLAFVHHPCGRWSRATENGGGDRKNHPDDLDLAREVAGDLADHYILENVPEAPLRDPVELNGKHFGMPIHYPRAFETSFRVEPSTGRTDFRPDFGPLAEQGRTGNAWVGETIGWRLAKGYTYPWPGRDLKRHAIPRPYVEHLLYYWLAALEDGTRSEQSSLVAATGGESLMGLSAFPYVGGKTLLAEWIKDHLPEHSIYVEPFGGSAAVLLNKPRSTIEVYNDLDGDLVQFFEVARERPDELKQWVQRTPYSEELHAKWVREFYSGKRPDDPVERAGRFLFLRYTQYAAKYESPSGFKRDTPRTRVGDSNVWRDVPDRIDAVCERLQGVSIQNRHFREVIDHYDRHNAAFYCDPPYLDKESTYLVDNFDHADLEDALTDLEGYALVSYTDRLSGLYEGWHEVARSHYHDSGARKDENEEEVTERLLTNYGPDDVPKFVDGQQQTLVAATDGGNARSLHTKTEQIDGGDR